jgi:uncharacterized coiled-coil DUF342 family protein
VDSVKKSLADLEVQMKELSTKGNELKGDARKRWEQRQAELDEQRDSLQDKLDELRDTTDDTWESLKHTVMSARDNLKKSFDEAAREFKDD